MFLELNGLRLEASEQDAAHATRALSAREMDADGFAEWLRTCTTRPRTPRRPTAATPLPRRRTQAKKK